ncbi:hypothetical protein LAZ26_09865, partial [Haemophilus influenzae]|nr:hypothetical protein [Haemophilus influenzae]
MAVKLANDVENGIVLCGAAYGNAQAVFQKRVRAMQFFNQDAVLFERVKQQIGIGYAYGNEVCLTWKGV